MAALFLSVSSAYIITSSFFFVFPSLIRPKTIFTNPLFNQVLQSQSSKILRISHRGSPRYSTQNTMQAFRKIFHMSDCLQMDVCQTADQVLVVHHDKSLLRSCGVDKEVSDLKYDQLPRYQDKIKLDFSSGSCFTTNNQKIPKLESVFQMFQGMAMDIELKNPTKTAIKSFVQLVYRYQRQDHTIIGIRGSQNAKLREQYKSIIDNTSNKNIQDILTFMNDRSVMKLYLSYITGILPFISIKDSSLQIPIYSKQFQQWCVDRAKTNNNSVLKVKIGCQLLRFMNFISKPLIWHLKRRGVLTFGWVCNTKQSMERAAWMGVQGIMSDEPYQLDRFVQNMQSSQHGKSQ